jgi:hypothetical protein
VRVLLDEQLPRQFAPYLVGHDVRTTQQQGWAGLKNGDLMKQALAASNALEDLLPRIPTALAAIADAQPGQVVRVDA